jgi:transposase-like protein
MFSCPTRAIDWRPPHCPNPNCRHHNGLPTDWRYKKIGFYRRAQSPFRIQRFTCLHCRRSFSSQTFSTTYWQRLPHLDHAIFMKTVGGMANRQIARDLGVSPETVNRHISRLGRHCLLLHSRLMKGAPPATEIVVDGFESFELSQYYPFHHQVAVEKGTDFFIYHTDSELRRKGRMTPHQKQRRLELERKHGRPDPRAIEKDMRHLLETVLPPTQSARVYSDDHPAYRRPIRNLKQPAEHLVTPGRDHRDRHNSLWEVNLLDLLIRHSSANHKRETIAWSKRRQRSAERLSILLVWRNYMKRRREKVRGSPTPAMERGMMSEPMDLETVLGGREFRSRTSLPQRWAEYYDGTVRTRGLERNRTHNLSCAI